MERSQTPADVQMVAAAAGLQLVRYRGRIVAAAAPERVYLAPTVAALPSDDPLLRFVAAMCLYAGDVETGALPRPYNDIAAELYARCVLIADAGFREREHEPDELLAQAFGVPPDQIAAKRRDLAHEETNGGRAPSPGTYPRRRRTRR